MKYAPLTKEEVCFAADNHKLIYRYLSNKHLPKDEYYDIAVFGYLKAVKGYFAKERLRSYSFSTICWKYMSREISNYRKSQQRQKRAAKIVCMQSGQTLNVEAYNHYSHAEMAKMQERLLLYELSLHIREEEMQIVKLYCDGYSLREICKIKQVKMRQVRDVLKTTYDTLKQICYTNEERRQE